MAEEPKKISFGFSKINRKTSLVQTAQLEKEESQVEFIACLDNKSIKLINGEEKKKDLPVIPMKVASTLRESIIQTLNSRKAKKDDKENSKTVQNGEAKPLTLDEMAAKEIMEDIQKEKNPEESKNTNAKVSLPSIGVVSEKEPTLDDYNDMPITDFGLAMLRGMGWDETKGIGLNEKVVKPVQPPLRPKGMGLGADKTMLGQKNQNENQDLVMKKGAFVKVKTGPHSNLYGKVEGFGDLPGRILVKLALQGDIISLSEFMVDLINQSEYNKNSKVMNLEKFNQFSEKKPQVANLKMEKSDDKSAIHKDENIRYLKKDRGSPYSSDIRTSKNRHLPDINSRRNRSPSSEYDVKPKKKKHHRHHSSQSSEEHHRSKTSKHKRKDRMSPVKRQYEKHRTEKRSRSREKKEKSSKRQHSRSRTPKKHSQHRSRS